MNQRFIGLTKGMYWIQVLSGVIKLVLLGTVRGFSLFMRDGSTARGFFNVGDKVEVTAEVVHRPPQGLSFSSKGMIGIVKDVWDKCEVDPHCCCAELAFDAPYEVSFNSFHYYGRDSGISSWTAHFSDEEIALIRISGGRECTGEPSIDPSKALAHDPDSEWMNDHLYADDD